MNADPTDVERSHYDKLVGRHIVAVFWENMEGQALPVLLLSDCDQDGNAATVAVLCDPEGNGPGHLEHTL